MSYSRRYWHYPRKGSYTQPKPTTNFSSFYKSLAYVKSELFNFDSFTFERFSDFYAHKYGDGPRRYLKQTFVKWQSGGTNMSPQTEQRILACVPPFLDTGKQFRLLSFQISQIIQQQQSEIKKHRIKTSELVDTYKGAANRIVQREYKLDWFVEEIFSSDEVNEFLNVLKYTMLDCLRISYSAVREDITFIYNSLPKVEGSMVTRYYIQLLDCELEIDVYPPPGAKHMKITIPEPKLVTKLKDGYKKILLEHALNQYKEEQVSQATRYIALKDIFSTINQLQQTKSSQEYDLTMDVKGHGGTLNIHLQKKNLLRLRYAMIKQVVKLLIALGIIGLITVYLYANGIWNFLFIFGIISIGIISVMWGTFNDLRMEVKEYVRRRTA